MRAFYLSVLYNYPRPDIRWVRSTSSKGGNITLYVKNAEPLEIYELLGSSNDYIRVLN